MTSTATKEVTVEQLESTAGIVVLPFAVALPPSTLQGFDEPSPSASTSYLVGDNGVTGTITILKNAVQVWVGWGKLQSSSNTTAGSKVQPCGAPTMGQFLVAMPRTKYQGAFSSDRDASSSLLIGSASSEDQMLASQMVCRLTQKTGKAVFISCQLSTGEDEWVAGLDREMISHRAAALAEKEIWRILQEYNQRGN